MDESTFLNKTKAAFEDYLQSSGNTLPENCDDYLLVELLTDIFENFLCVDGLVVEELYNTKYNQNLINFLCNNYTKDSFVYFLMFIIHFIIEEQSSLLIRKFECTGTYFGHWATAYLYDNQIGNLVNERIHYLNYKEDYPSYYLQMFIDNNKIKLSIPENHNYTLSTDSRLLKAIVGASGAALLLGSLIQWGKKHIKLWKSSDDVSQVMFTIMTAPGSVKLFGFCMERMKPSPKKDSSYVPIYIYNIKGDIEETYKRIDYFIEYLNSFLTIKNDKIISIADKNSRKIWFHLQQIFWLITQKFAYDDKKDSSEYAKEFVIIQTTEQLRIRGLEFTGITKSEYDIEMKILIDESIKIISSRLYFIYPLNLSIFDALKNI
jgi:hypothetical protein